ncbi:MAG: hypothetical protein NC301_08620 [Bacteroides sp.]|nr:hypothetical protein [Alistipes timonensis]MCM1311067.1 hypothetical protein [Bacteroides sp.]MCM1405708.1 hypothetical protein [[Clostridium] fimetarium]
MTVQELFNSLTFDDIMAALRCTHRDDRSIRNVAGYKEAYDVFRNLKPKGDGGDVTFAVASSEEGFAPRSLPLVANNVEGDYWENTIRKTVIKPDGAPFTDAELAGAILWGMTFYGFTERDEWPLSDSALSRYGEQAKLLERKLYIPYLRDKAEMRELKKGKLPSGIAFSMEEWKEIHQRQRHQNRSKRRRLRRMEQRIERLKKLDKRQHLIDRLQEAIGSEATLASEILKAESVNEKWFDSHCYGKLPRLDYLIDLLDNYCPYFDEICQSGDCGIVVCHTASATPLTDDEKNRLLAFLANHFPPDSDWQLFFATDNAHPDEMALQFIGIKTRLC